MSDVRGSERLTREAAYGRLAEQLNLRIPGHVAEIGVGAARKTAASGLPALLLEAEGGWAVGGYLARLLLKRVRSTVETARHP